MSTLPRRGRVRRWSYAAAGDENVLIGAAVVEVAPAAVAFAWCWDGNRLHRWEARGLVRRHARVGRQPTDATWFERGRAKVEFGRHGAMDLDVPVGARRLTAQVEVAATTPAVLVTETPAGGWNVTRKVAGEPATGKVTVDGRDHHLEGATWRDWTAGRQDRHTTWRWAAGAGRDELRGRHVGLNVSTGMNGSGAGEDVVWWDGTPFGLTLTELAPVADDPRGRWRIAGDGWSIVFEPFAVREAAENLVVIRSRYVQPIGRFTGTLPGRDGGPVPVVLHGVTEDHEAVW